MKYSIYYFDDSNLRRYLGDIEVNDFLKIDDIISYLINEKGYPGNIFLLESVHC